MRFIPFDKEKKMMTVIECCGQYENQCSCERRQIATRKQCSTCGADLNVWREVLGEHTSCGELEITTVLVDRGSYSAEELRMWDAGYDAGHSDSKA